jgi:hypothetical protein
MSTDALDNVSEDLHVLVFMFWDVPTRLDPVIIDCLEITKIHIIWIEISRETESPI